MLQITLSCDFLLWTYFLSQNRKLRHNHAILVKDYLWLKKKIVDKLIYLSAKLQQNQCNSIDQLNAIEALLKAAIDNKICSWRNLGFDSSKHIYDYIIDNRQRLEKEIQEEFASSWWHHGAIAFQRNIKQSLPGFELPLNEKDIQELSENCDDTETINCCNNRHLNKVIIIEQDKEKEDGEEETNEYSEEAENILEFESQDVPITLDDEFILEFKIADIPESINYHLRKKGTVINL